MNRTRGREQHFADRLFPPLGLDSEIRSSLFQPAKTFLPQVSLRLDVWWLPMRIGQPRPPPIFGRVILLPQQPDLTRVVGQQILAREAYSDGEPFRAFAHQHHVAGML